MTPRVLDALVSAASGKATIAAYKTAWRAVRLAPAFLAYGFGDQAADLMWRRGGKGVARMRANYARVRPELSDAQLDRLVRAGLRSYLRYAIDSFRLPDRTADELRATVRPRNDAAVRAHLESGRAVVVFVGHMGNWDVAGAWSTQNLAPVTTVAERLKPEEVFREFFAFRERLGMTILPLTGAGDPFAGLVAAVERGDFVALAADRDLTRGGVEVDFFGRRARMAKGPAALALRTGAALFAAEIHFEKAPAGEGMRGMGGYFTVVGFSDEIRPPAGEGLDPTLAVQAMTQGCAAHLEAAIREHTEDWHMMQKVFVEDLDPSRDAAR
ncbi:MAG TPA: phosphatidylinositol mannoside acyltransferase [Dermatophilaceae bacterium]|nr:phosphatidylinositol mannoside acyltransferase [Dermatophilaceae bacterium]